jgi:hypothetical protein
LVLVVVVEERNQRNQSPRPLHDYQKTAQQFGEKRMNLIDKEKKWRDW